LVIDGAAAGAALTAANIALVLSERGLGGNDVDLAQRLDALRHDRSPRAQEARGIARRWAETARAEPGAHTQGGEPETNLSPGVLLALAYPDRIARNRGVGGAFLLANGRGGTLDLASPLARKPFLAVAEIVGGAVQGRIALAAALTLGEIDAHFSSRIESCDEITYDEQTTSLRGRRLRRLGAITLAAEPTKVVPNEDTARMLAQGVVQKDMARLPWTKSLLQWRDRVSFLRRLEGEEWPDLSDDALAATAADWLAPLVIGKTSAAALGADELTAAVHGLVPWKLRRRLELEAPTHFAAPSGSSVPIDYNSNEGPRLSIRVQELFGLKHHPAIAGGRVPLLIELLSPAHRPVQVTRDLPGFWRGSYAAVKAEMKGRYPRHPWPDDPIGAPATRRAKRRGEY
jgi:ATP-dependent helicase HrpB